jgi:hypothetical protein
MPVHAFCSPQKVSRFTLGRSPGLEVADCVLPVASPSPADTLSGCSKRRALTHSGGTAPDSHRSSLLCPSWAPEALTVISSAFHFGQGNRPNCRHVDSFQLTFSRCVCSRRSSNQGVRRTTAFAGISASAVPARECARDGDAQPAAATSPTFHMFPSRTNAAVHFCCDRRTATRSRAQRTS